MKYCCILVHRKIEITSTLKNKLEKILIQLITKKTISILCLEGKAFLTTYVMIL